MFQNLDVVLIIELAVILVIVIAQLGVFFGNQASISKLRRAMPESHKLDLEYVPINPGKVTEEDAELTTSETNKVLLIKNSSKFSQVFQEVVNQTNEYVMRNRGGTNFPGLQTIVDSKIRSLEERIDDVVALPLYLGLLGTFTGVIIGLIRIAFTGVTDRAIESFIGGVLIGMIASAFGLFLTVRSNQVFKNAKKTRDENMSDYLNFIRLNLLSRSYKALPVDMRKLQYNLAAFSDEFLGYQQRLNHSLDDTLKRFDDLRDVMEKLRALESGLDNIGLFNKNINTLLERQVESLENVTQKTASLTTEIGLQMDRVGGKLRRLEEGENGSYETSTVVGTSQGNYLMENEQINLSKSMLERVENTEAINQQISMQLNNLYAFLQKTLSGDREEREDVGNSFSFKVFTFFGSIASILGVVIGIWYLFTQILPLYF